MRDAILRAACLALLTSAGAAMAQTTTPPAGTLEAPPEKIEPQPPIGAPPAAPSSEPETLSETLQETRGVIKPPPGLDPGVVEPTPDPKLFPTPVIPPSAVTPQAAPQ